MNEKTIQAPHDERELELQEAEGRAHRAALLFYDSVRLDLLPDEDELDEDELVDDQATSY